MTEEKECLHVYFEHAIDNATTLYDQARFLYNLFEKYRDNPNSVVRLYKFCPKCGKLLNEKLLLDKILLIIEENKKNNEEMAIKKFNTLWRF